MGLIAAVGKARLLDGREAGIQAARQALNGMGRSPVTFGFVISTHIHPIQQVLAGVLSVLGDTPLLGFSSSGELSSEGWSRRSVVVGLLGGESIQARSDWWPGYVDDSRSSIQKLLASLYPVSQPGSPAPSVMLLVADGFNGDSAALEGLGALSESIDVEVDPNLKIAGCLAGGDLQRGRTFQIGGRQAGSSGLAGALLSGKLAVGVGAGHGWQPVGAYARLTRVQGLWVNRLDEQPASKTYSRLFGHTPREWGFSPLNELVRLYPLGVEQADRLQIRSPLRMEADGSLRMNTTISEGMIANLLVGDPARCIESARQAAEQALKALGPAKPVLAWVLVDAAWQALMEASPGNEMEPLREVLGPDLPIIGGYTYGQVQDSTLAPTRPRRLEVLNQHIQIILFGEPA